MKNPFEKRQSKGPKASRLLEIDAWIDSTLYEAQFAASELWENITIFFRRFRMTGWRRGVFEILSEGFTMGAAGSVVMLALAMPAFEETSKNWRAQDDYSVTFLDRYGNEIGKRGILQRDSVPVDEMPDYVINSVLATEDRRFFEHFGIDIMGLARAMFENARANAVVQGGSTLTQQLAKNLFLSNERTIERKVKEAFLSLWLEANLTKKEILQLYLDRAYMGGGAFGIAAAADFYFKKDVKSLTLAEAAMLAGLFKAPAKYAPHVNLPAARARANEVLTNLVQSEFMTEGQVVAARRLPATPVDREGTESPDYYLDWAFDQVKAIALANKLDNHSFVARTTIDMNLQKAAEESCEFHLRQFGKSYGVDECAMVLVETNGAVRAIVGGRDYGKSQFNRATKALRQAGSSFKPYIYAAAMEAGLTPETVVPDAPISWGKWSPKNYTRGYAGRIPLTTALVKSINTVPVRLIKEKIPGGTETVKKLAEEMGVESELSTHKTMALGISGMTVLDQATGYLTFANGGYSGTRHAVTQLLNHSGEILFDVARNGPEKKRVLTEKTVEEMNSILVQIPEWGTARRAALDMTPAAGKTGTTQAYRDAWFVGFTGNFAAAVWMGNDDYTPTNRLTGGSLPAMTWKRLMEYAHQNIDLKPIPGANRPIPEKPADAKPAETVSAEGNELPRPERPLVLSADTIRVLNAIQDAFRDAKPVPGPSDSTKVSAVTPGNSTPIPYADAGPMFRTLAQIAVILALAFGGGIWSVRTMLESAVRPGSVTVSAWTAYPVAGTPAADPYTKAHIARNGELPLGAGEGLTFSASRDSAGDAITGACTYRIEGQMPAARLWTLHAESLAGGYAPVEGLPTALHSRRVLYGADGAVRIQAADGARPGNWLAIPSQGRLAFVLTFYDTELASGSRAYEAEMPQILKDSCDG